MKIYLSLLFSCFLLFSCSTTKEVTYTENWQQLFNGKDLDGWFPKIRGQEFNANFQNTFMVEDSLLTINYAEYDSFNNQFGHLFYKDPFSWYKLRVEYRFVGDQMHDAPEWAFRNNGLMLHSQAPGTMGLNQDFPSSIEIQLLGGDGEHQRSTANLCTPGTNVVMNGELVTGHCYNSTSETFHGDQWVTVEVRVYGDSLIQHFVGDQLVLSYEKPQIGGGAIDGFAPGLFKDGTLLESGYITIQSESHPTQFRKIELLNLEGCTDKKASNYQPWVLKNRSESCEYND